MFRLSARPLAEVPVEEQHRQRDHDQTEDAAVVQTLGSGFPWDVAWLGLFQQRRIDHFRRLRLHGPVQQRQAHHQHGDDDQVVGGEQRLADADGLGQRATGHLLQIGAAAGQRQRNRAGKAAVPDQEAGVGRGHQQRVVDAAHLARQRAGEHRADHQAETPVDPGTGQRHQGHQDDGLARRLRDARHAVEQAVDRRRPCQGMAGDQDQRHLHGKGQQVPEAVAPVLRHGRQA